MLTSEECLSSNKNDYLLNLVLNNDNTFFIGRNSYFNSILTITLSERKNVIIGQDCLFSKEIQFRVADSHLIYSSKSLKRINPTKSIYIGDHVWLGQNSLILKGCHIGSGSIIGAGTILSNKKIPSNCIFAGNPAKLVKKDIFWDPSVVHEWSIEKTKSMERYTSKNNIFDFDENETTDFNAIENKLDSLETSEEKLDYIKNNLTSVTKNRFFIGEKIKMTRNMRVNVLILINKVFNKLKMN